jgi:fatty acid desaturase
MKDWRSAFSREELRSLRTARDRDGWAMVLSNFAIIAAALALVAWLPRWWTVLPALFLVGGRQLGMAIVMHEAAHRTLFRNRWLNDLAGDWGGAYWVFLSLPLYRPYHLQHHAHAGTELDPDLALKTPYPAGGASLVRKCLRDVFFVTGVKRFLGTLELLVEAARSSEVETGAGEAEGGARFFGQAISKADAIRTLRGFAVTQLLLFGLLLGLGHPGLYLVWAAAWLGPYSLSMRIRSIAEHGMTPQTRDPFRNTRTVRANLLERLLFAPSRVNFHLEHHLAMTVPHAQLPRFHRLLQERGLLKEAEVMEGYRAVLRDAARSPSPG